MPWSPQYTTLNELKSYVRIDAIDVKDDAELTVALEAASRAIDNATNRQFGQVAANQNRFYTARFDKQRCLWTIDIDDLMDNTGITVNADIDDNGVFDNSIDSFTLAPFNAAAANRPWVKIIVKSNSVTIPTGKEGNVQVFAKFGWLSVPQTIKQATLLQASRFFKRRDAPFGVAGSPEMGNEIRLLAQIDADVRVTIQSYKRWWGAV